MTQYPGKWVPWIGAAATVVCFTLFVMALLLVVGEKAPAQTPKASPVFLVYQYNINGYIFTRVIDTQLHNVCYLYAGEAPHCLPLR